MQRLMPIRYFAALSIALCPVLHAQIQRSQLPATSPTEQSQPQSITLPPVPAPPPTHRAQVAYAQGQLSISADNSSLNQILRDVAHQTGMKITGGVAEEHVFGQYGPAKPARVLAMLLEGTGSNILLVQSGAAAPTELILTPRTGGATPPNPNAPNFNDAADNEDTPPRSAERVLPRRPLQPGELDPNRPDPPATLLPPNNPPDATPSAQDQSPNGIKTPQQIYDQLMRLRQQNQPQQPTPQ